MFQHGSQLQQHEAPSSPSGAQHLISAPPHVPALHDMADMPLSLPDLAAYGDQHRHPSHGHVHPASGSLAGTLSAFTAPLFGVSEFLLPTNAVLGSALLTEDHAFGGHMPPVSSPNPLGETGGRGDRSNARLQLPSSHMDAAAASLPSWAHLSSGGVFTGLPSVSAGAAAAAAALSGPVVQLPSPLAVVSSSSLHPLAGTAAERGPAGDLGIGRHPVRQPHGLQGQHWSREASVPKRLLEASGGGNQGSGDGGVRRAASEADLRGTKRQKTAWSGTTLAEGGQQQQQQQSRQQHNGSNAAASLPRRRPPLRSANVDARAPPDADSGTDTDDDEDLLQRTVPSHHTH